VTYPYRDEEGNLLFECVRYRNPKRFAQRRPDGKGGFVWNLQGIRRVPYLLPELLAADPAEIVLVVEGEKDVDRLRSLQFVATCNPMGAGKWLPEYADHFAGRRVCILLDNDQAGREHGQQVARSLFGVAAEVQVLELPGLPEKGDASDWLDRGGTCDELGRLIYNAPRWTPPQAPVVHGNGHANGRVNGNGRGGDDTTAVLDEHLSGYPCTDLGNAERLVRRCGHDLRYCHPWKAWLAWDGRRWKLDDTGEVRRRGRDTVRAILGEARTEDDDDRRKQLALWSFTSEKRDRLSALISMAEFQEGIPIIPGEMDQDPWAFNVANGTIDLETGALRHHRRGDGITKLCDVPYDPDAQCPLWLATLARCFHRPDPTYRDALVDYWQRLCGYALSGVIRDHILPVAYGTGSNGKSTILGALLDVFGPDYAMKAPPDLFMAKKNDAHPTDRTDLFGKRLVVAIETEMGRRLNETMVKELTGGDRIRARRMREDNWEFSPTHKVIMGTNHKPSVRGTDHGIWRRIRLFPFTVKISESEADRTVPERLRAEREGILAWIVQGCLEWQRRGLDAPAEVTEATADYRAEQDVLGSFLAECAREGWNLRVKASELYARYKAWGEGGNEFVLNQTQFSQQLQERGFTRVRNNGTFYVGLGLIDFGGGELSF
jgi:putative DNA primase/helicase